VHTPVLNLADKVIDTYLCKELAEQMMKEAARD